MVVAQSYPTLCDLMGYSPPGSSVHGIVQVVVLGEAFRKGNHMPRGSKTFVEWPLQGKQCTRYNVVYSDEQGTTLGSKEHKA